MSGRSTTATSCPARWSRATRSPAPRCRTLRPPGRPPRFRPSTTAYRHLQSGWLVFKDYWLIIKIIIIYFSLFSKASGVLGARAAAERGFWWERLPIQQPCRIACWEAMTDHISLPNKPLNLCRIPCTLSVVDPRVSNPRVSLGSYAGSYGLPWELRLFPRSVVLDHLIRKDHL